MRRKLLVIAAAAFLGFIVAWGILAFSYIADLRGYIPSVGVMVWCTRVILLLCPASIFSLGLDNASLPVVLSSWLYIALSNAVLYGAVGTIVSLFVPRRPH